MTAYILKINKGKVTCEKLTIKRKPMTRYELFLNKWRRRYQNCDMSQWGDCIDAFEEECRKRFPDKFLDIMLMDAQILSQPVTN